MKFPASKHHQVINVVQIDSNNRIERLLGISKGHLIRTHLSRVMPASDNEVPDLILKLSRALNSSEILIKSLGRVNFWTTYVTHQSAFFYGTVYLAII